VTLGYTEKKELRERLESEHRWDAFKAHREALKRQGVDESKVWEQAALAFEPLPEGGAQPAPAKPVEEARTEDFINKTASNPESVQWVADNLEIPDVKPTDAPSKAAWSLLRWARKSVTTKDRFWTQVFTKLMPTGKQLEEGDRQGDDGASIIELCNRVEAALPDGDSGG
jgi:hypothetical protein